MEASDAAATSRRLYSLTFSPPLTPLSVANACDVEEEPLLSDGTCCAAAILAKTPCLASAITLGGFPMARPLADGSRSGRRGALRPRCWDQLSWDQLTTVIGRARRTPPVPRGINLAFWRRWGVARNGVFQNDTFSRQSS